MSQQDKVWWYATGDQRFGPYSGSELRAIASTGKIATTDLIWKEGLANWLPASSVKGLLPPAPASVPPPLPTTTHSNSAPPAQANSTARVVKEIAQKEPQSSEQRSSSAGIPESWKRIFDLIEKAGGPKLKKARDLSFGDMSKVSFNGFGFLFGPIYYLVKGMWKKAIVLLSICLIAIVILDLILDAMGISNSMVTNFIAPAMFANRANIDYYKKMVLGDNGWW